MTVTNVAPTVTLTGADERRRGLDPHLQLHGHRPGRGHLHGQRRLPDLRAQRQLVAGSLNVTAAGGSFQCTFPDGPASTSVAVKVTDSDGASDTDSEDVLVVAIANVAPTVTGPADQTANEGASTTFNLGSFTDPGPDGPWAVSVDWGDGSTDTTVQPGSAGSLGTTSHTYADGPATRPSPSPSPTRTAPSTRTRFTVTVANVAPTVAFTAGPVTVNEGATEHPTATRSAIRVTDTVSSVAASCGDAAASSSPAPTRTATSRGSFNCTFPDGPASSTVSVQATDSDERRATPPPGR